MFSTTFYKLGVILKCPKMGCLKYFADVFKIFHEILENVLKSLKIGNPREFWGLLEDTWEPLWPQDGPKLKNLRKSDLLDRTSRGPAGSQNLRKK